MAAPEPSSSPMEEDGTDEQRRQEHIQHEIFGTRGGGVPAMMAPNLPTPEERARHLVDHMPYAAWCRSCVAGKGKADPHFLKTSDDLGVQGVACDYCFMGDTIESDKATDKCLPILVHKFYGDRWVSARVVPHKGPETYAVKATVDDLMQAGFAKFTYKSDGEPAIKSLKQEVVKKLREVAGPVDVILEESGTAESQQNAVVERAIWEIQSTARTLVHACLEHHRVQVPLKHPLRIYAVEYAGQLLNRSQRAAKDNRTAYEIRKGKPYRRKLPPFGEAVMYMPVSTVRRRRKFEDRWETGIYLGLVERSNMLLVGTTRGVFKVNCVKRLPEIQSSDPELLKSIVGVPWDPVPGEAGGQTVDYEPLRATEPIVPDAELPPRVPKPRSPEAIPRRFYIRREVELRAYGFSDNCPGCAAAFEGRSARPHTQDCRNRIEAAIMADERYEVRQRVEEAHRRRGEAGAPPDRRPGGAQILRPGEVAGEVPTEAGEHAMSDQSGSVPEVSTSTRADAQSRPDSPEAGSTVPARNPGQDQATPRAEAGDTVLRRGEVRTGEDPVGSPHERAAKRARREVAEIVGELMHLGAAIGPRLREAIKQPTKNDVDMIESEVFCKRRFTDQTSRWGVHPGVALDLSASWNLQNQTHVEQAESLRSIVRPKLLIGHLHFRDSRNMYLKQLQDGNYFLHEHMNDAAPGHEQGGDEKDENGSHLLEHEGVQHVKAGKAAEWLTNSRCIVEELTKLQGDDHENVTISTMETMSPTVEDKPAVVAAVLRGLRRQLQQDGAISINALDPGVTGHDAQEWDEDGLEQFFDELTGERLNPKDVREAKVKEIEFLRTFPVYEKVPEAMAKGKEFISTRWNIINKGDANAPNVRARFVGREFKWKSPAMENTFAATPPLESLKYLLSRFQSRRRGPTRSPGERKILVLDVSRAHFHPKCRRELYIRLPEEDAQAGFVGRLLRTLYGTRDAANAWDEFFNEAIVRREYEVGLSSPCLYYCAAEDSSGWRHGDDLVFEGPDEWLDRLEEGLRSVMILQRRAKLGWGAADDKHVTILNRLVDLKDDSRVVTLEPDPRHVDLLRGLVGFDGRSKSVTTPADKRLEDMHDEEPLSRVQATAFRSATMRLAYLAADVPVYGFSVNRLARFMAKPTVGSWARLKRCLRYLHGHGRWIQYFPAQDKPDRIDVYTDSDWAQDPDRKSVSCIVTMHGQHCLRVQVATQTAPALSSGEAEFVAQVKGGSTAIGMRSMIRDMGGQVAIDLHTDSTAGKGIASRVGMGKIRHLDTGLLWLQHHVNRRDLRIKKVHKDKNLADIGTKAINVTVQETLMNLMNFKEAHGRHPKALKVAS